MTTSTHYSPTENEKKILRDILLYSLGVIDQRVASGETAPYLAHRRGLASVLCRLDGPEAITLDDSEYLAIEWVLSLICTDKTDIQDLMRAG